MKGNTLLLFLVFVCVCAGQSYTSMYTPGTVISLWTWCTNPQTGALITNCAVSAGTMPYANSNGHAINYHSTATPSSRMSTSPNGPWSQGVNFSTGPYGYVQVHIRAGWRDSSTTDIRRCVGQAERETVCSAAGCFNNDYAVGYGPDPLYFVSERPEWIHIGQTPQHYLNNPSYNHWMTSGAAHNLLYATQHYLADHPTQGRIAVNDMSLPFGGLFDISGNWEPSHWEHDKGKAVDVRGNGGQYSLPRSDNNTHQYEFVNLCRAYGALLAQVEAIGTTNQHVHCQW